MPVLEVGSESDLVARNRLDNCSFPLAGDFARRRDSKLVSNSPARSVFDSNDIGNVKVEADKASVHVRSWSTN